MANTTCDEPVIEPNLPIVDAHHHLWMLSETALTALQAHGSIAAEALVPTFRRHSRYLLDEFVADLSSGHNVLATVFVEAHAMYRPHGPPALQSVGEVEFVNGVAAMADSGVFGNVKVSAAIVGNVDLRLGSEVEAVLDAHLRAGGSRYRGIRSPGVAHDDDESILGPGVPHLLLDTSFREGFKRLQPLDLSFDAWLLEPQLPDLIDLARAFPDTQIVLDHVGAPLAIGRYTGQRRERFALWRDQIHTLSGCTNVAVKLGGLGIPFGGFRSYLAVPPATSAELAEEWKPYIETCIEEFGVHRCMFESNFPVDAAAGSYRTLWNAFKRIVTSASPSEKTALFSGTAKRIYRLEI